MSGSDARRGSINQLRIPMDNNVWYLREYVHVRIHMHIPYGLLGRSFIAPTALYALTRPLAYPYSRSNRIAFLFTQTHLVCCHLWPLWLQFPPLSRLQPPYRYQEFHSLTLGRSPSPPGRCPSPPGRSLSPPGRSPFPPQHPHSRQWYHSPSRHLCHLFRGSWSQRPRPDPSWR